MTFTYMLLTALLMNSDIQAGALSASQALEASEQVCELLGNIHEQDLNLALKNTESFNDLDYCF
jgi:hypothetical protein